MSPKLNPGSMRRILIIRLGAIGDVLLSTPVVRVLSERFPELRIDFLTKEAYISILKNHSNLNRVIGFSQKRGFRALHEILRFIRRGKYDAVVDLQNNLRSRIFTRFSGVKFRKTFHSGRIKRFFLVHFRWNVYRDIQPVPLKYLRTVRDLGAEDDGKGLDLFVEPAAERSVRAKFKKTGVRSSEPILALAPGAGRATKRWPCEQFANVGLHFVRKGFQVVILGGPKDADACESVRSRMSDSSVSFCGILTLQETAALLKHSVLLVTNDTGLMHMASALKKKTVAIFGPTTRHFGFFPFRSPAAVVETDLRCRPCSYHGTEHCPKRHFRCMLAISSAEVIGAAERVLKSE
jgi:lipopolysaccharide heptosyltransferase II